jgi:cold shock CspA family protein
MNNESNYTLGVIKWYSDENQYGVIEEVNTHKEVFLHFKNWVDNYSMTNITSTQVLVFEVAEEKNKITAKNCRFFDYSKADYILLYKLTLMYDHYLYVKGESNKETKIVNILNNKHSLVNHFIEILHTNFQDVQNENFLEEIKRLRNLFNNELISKEFAAKESLKRFKLSSSNEFKLQLIEQNYVNIHDVEFSFILEYIEIDFHLLNKIKNHPQFLENIFHILDKKENSILKKELVKIAIEINLQDVTKYIDELFHSLNQDEFIDSLLEIKDRLDSSDIIYDIDSTVSECLTRVNNKKITYDAYKKKLIDLSELDIVENYIDFIDRTEFLNIIQKNNKNTDLIEIIFTSINNQALLRFLIEKIEEFELENYKIYFDFGVKNLTKLNEENQVLYLKKLFHLKKINLLNFSNTDLIAFYNIIVIKDATINSHDKDFSTFLIIDLLSKFNENDGFLATNELIKSVLNIIESTPDKKVQIGEYFDDCDGYAREIVAQNDNVISKESFVTQQGTTNYYFKITFEYDENIVNDIKNIPGRKYNQVEKFWGAPLKSQKEVINFGKKHNFLIKLNDGNYFNDNLHLLKIEKNYKEKPIGIQYCCGQKSPKLSETSRKEFWWCNNSPCFQNNINHHQSWKEYTLFDFMNILEFNIDEQKKDGSIVYEGLYTRFVTFINRFNKLLEKLYCLECNHVLYPAESSNFAAYSVTKFICKNDNCSCKNQIVYLNHCLNHQCNATIDSRVSKKCNNNWYICNECGSCCSHATYERRLNNLNTTTGQVDEGLLFAVNNKIGHLEKAEYFCYKCGQVMVEHPNKKFKCRDCNIDYKLSDYSQIEKLWVHKNLRQSNYPTILNTLIPQFRQILLNEKQELLQQGRQKNQIFGILYNKVIDLEGVSLCLKELNDKQLTNSIFD